VNILDYLFAVNVNIHYYNRVAFFSDMRKALSADVNKESIIPLPFPVRPEDLE
jgi:hypothetical protein